MHSRSSPVNNWQFFSYHHNLVCISVLLHSQDSELYIQSTQKANGGLGATEEETVRGERGLPNTYCWGGRCQRNSVQKEDRHHNQCRYDSILVAISNCVLISIAVLLYSSCSPVPANINVTVRSNISWQKLNMKTTNINSKTNVLNLPGRGMSEHHSISLMIIKLSMNSGVYYNQCT